MKSFFENPEMLLGSPFLVIGIVGAIIALLALLMYWINPNPTQQGDR